MWGSQSENKNDISKQKIYFCVTVYMKQNQNVIQYFENLENECTNSLFLKCFSYKVAYCAV